ncbi:MAG: L-ribulose-5-phosphate 4-epimerase [Erysipelotrichaceae bacterium]
MLEELKQEVLDANLCLPKYGLVVFTWGNVSAIDKSGQYVAIKPSGVEYDVLTRDDIVIVDLNGNVIEGHFNPSSDTPTHLELYRNFPGIKGIVHTHSRWATIFSQAKLDLNPFGTTHADYFYGKIPCTRLMSCEEIENDYELNTGKVIVETFKNIDSLHVQAVLVASHGPFAWGKSAMDAVHQAVVLEEIAMMNWHAFMINKDLGSMQNVLLNKHFLRKHGKNAYYGQK